MKQTITGFFKSQEQAELALQSICLESIISEDISLLKINNENDLIYEPFHESHGFAIQGNKFETAELGEMFIAGPLGERLKNTKNSIHSILKASGVTEIKIQEYEKELKTGKTMLISKTNSKKASKVANIMSEYGGNMIAKWNKNINHETKVLKSP